MNKMLTLVLLTLINSICLGDQNPLTVSNCDFLNNVGDVSRLSCGILQESKMTNAHAFILDAGGHGGGDMGCKRSIMDVFMSNPNGIIDTSCLKLYKQ